jgi:hypothetical protein
LRVAFRRSGWWPLYELLFDPGDFVMMRGMLRGIKQRAERAWASQRAEASAPIAAYAELAPPHVEGRPAQGRAASVSNGRRRQNRRQRARGEATAAQA